MTKMTKTNMWHQLRQDESGFLISSELVIIGTVAVLAMIVGLEAVSSAVTQELNDLSNALGAINQSYHYRSIAKSQHAWVSGSRFGLASDGNGQFLENDAAVTDGDSRDIRRGK